MQHKLYMQYSRSTAFPTKAVCFMYINVNNLHKCDNKDNRNTVTTSMQ